MPDVDLIKVLKSQLIPHTFLIDLVVEVENHLKEVCLQFVIIQSLSNLPHYVANDCPVGLPELLILEHIWVQMDKLFVFDTDVGKTETHRHDLVRHRVQELIN